jgi:hypothetical protein
MSKELNLKYYMINKDKYERCKSKNSNEKRLTAINLRDTSNNPER